MAAQRVLSGSAWGENTGWIDFSGVTINSSGQFTGTAEGDIVGTVNFDCTSTGCPVTTDWRQVSCGDGTCNGTETCSVCSQDCGSCSGGTSGGYVQPKPLVLTVNSAYISSALDKNVILSGISTPEAEIIFSWDDKYGMIIVGSSGKWEANLGKMSVGNHSILLIAKNSAGDTKTLTVSVEVKEQQEKPLPAGRQEPANQNNKIRSLINLFFSKKSAPSSSFIIIPKEAPEVLKGEWNLLPIKVNNQ
ncbi:MAG: hypothetical protein NT026_02110 [Candidatus Staskawiczbacteria bacterium]|nr:hypothetical protein [Candidatus Staskawiczbacteria bacterium]